MAMSDEGCVFIRMAVLGMAATGRFEEGTLPGGLRVFSPSSRVEERRSSQGMGSRLHRWFRTMQGKTLVDSRG